MPAPSDAPALVEHLFRHEHGRLVAVLTRLFGFDRLEVAEDLVQDTFVQAYETWRLRGLPDNPTAWLYKVAKNKAYTFVQRQRTAEKAASDCAWAYRRATPFRPTSNRLFKLSPTVSSKCCSPCATPACPPTPRWP
jgi:RNA polymerase sigma-70 factor (ECF subfamily)